MGGTTGWGGGGGFSTMTMGGAAGTFSGFDTAGFSVADDILTTFAGGAVGAYCGGRGCTSGGADGSGLGGTVGGGAETTAAVYCGTA